MMETDLEAIGSLTNSLKHLHGLRISLHSLFDSLSSGPNEQQENQEYLRGIQQKLISMDKAFTELEGTVSSLPSVNPQLSNATAITLEPENENYEVFHQLCNAYSWTKKMQDYSSCVSTHLKENQLKRTGPATGYVAKRARKAYPDIHNVKPSTVDPIIGRASQLLSGKHADTLEITIRRPLGNSTILVISLAKILKAIIVFRGLIAERVVVRGFNEPGTLDNGLIDIWTQSKYKVFQGVTHSAQAAMLQLLNAPCQPEYSILTFLDSCTYCGRILNNNMPPTGRAMGKTPTAYHPQCHNSHSR